MANGNIGYIIFYRYSYPADLIFPAVICRAVHARLQCQPRAAIGDSPWAVVGLDGNPGEANTDDVVWWIYCDFKPHNLSNPDETSKVI